MANRLQRGQVGEMAAQYWFKKHDWKMIRTQPATTIIGILQPHMVVMLSRFIPRLSYFGHMVIARMGKGGAPDFTGYCGQSMKYKACEVKEVTGDTMPASRLDKAQRAFMDQLPEGSAFVGVLWRTGLFEVFPYKSKGSYKHGEGQS
jgi:hypothetical protein